MLTQSRVILTIDDLPYPILFILDWGNECPLFEDDRQVIHRHLARIFQKTKHDTIPEHTHIVRIS